MQLVYQVRIEYVQDPENHIEEVLRRVKKEYLQRQYSIFEWTSTEDFLTQMAYRTGKLLKVDTFFLSACAFLSSKSFCTFEFQKVND